MFDAVIFSILFCNAFLQSYELIYHFSYPVYFNYFMPPFLTGNDIRYLVLGFLPILPVFLMRKHLSFKKTSLVTLTVFVVIWVVWIMYGFPQYFSDEYFYPRILRTDDPYTLSMVLNFGSKVVLASFFTSLLKIGSIGFLGRKLNSV